MLKHFIKNTCYLIGTVLVFTNCNKINISNNYPSCIEDKIIEFKKNEVQNPPAQIWKWEDNGTSYFYVTSNCCDQYNYLYDENCNVVCAPDGGFTGNGDGNCPEFSSSIIKTLVWQDDRK